MRYFVNISAASKAGKVSLRFEPRASGKLGGSWDIVTTNKVRALLIIWGYTIEPCRRGQTRIISPIYNEIVDTSQGPQRRLSTAILGRNKRRKQGNSYKGPRFGIGTSL